MSLENHESFKHLQDAWEIYGHDEAHSFTLGRLDGFLCCYGTMSVHKRYSKEYEDLEFLRGLVLSRLLDAIRKEAKS